ncbi:PPR domain-containing protein/PPR_2 domain-containing protein, partial [Cephalotus follicularis]
CSKISAFRLGLSLHAAAFKTGLLSDVIISNHVLNMYSKCGNISSARLVFDQMSHRNLVSWSAMISGYDQVGVPLLALDLFSQMQFVPNEYIFASAIKPDSVSYNGLISGFVENQQAEKGFEAFKLMHRQGLMPDRFTFAGVLVLCSDLKRGAVLHCQTIKLKLDSTPFTGNIIISMYSAFNLIEEAEKVFRMIVEKDVISWNTLIAACSHCADHVKGLRVFKDMSNDYSVRPDNFTFTSALAACAGLASLRNGKQIHSHLITTRLNQDIGVGNALVNMYAKCGSIGHAFNVFNKMINRNLVSWNTMIAGFGNHGLGKRALELFEQMKASGVKPDSVTCVGLLTACRHSGMVDEGEFYFNSMEKAYGIVPEIEHFSCLIDLMGRAGRLRKAEEYMHKYPFGNDPVVLGSMLSACRLHGDIAIGERLARQLLKLQPVTASPYVLLSNLYASDEMWDGVAEARKKLKGSGLKKEPGHSLIEVRGMFEKFTIGDFSHSKLKEIKDMLTSIS